MSLINSCEDESKLATKSSFLNTEIRHVEQASKNDCGHACARMALNYLYRHQATSIQQDNQREFDTLLRSLGLEGVSLWTIDIAHICSLKNIKHQMYTITLGVNDNYSQEEFYSADKDFEFEKKRIKDKFQRAAELGIQVTKSSLSLNQIKHEIAQKNACIVLVNANLLSGENIDMDDGTMINDALTSVNTDIEPSFMSTLCCCNSSKNRIAMGEVRARSPPSIRSPHTIAMFNSLNESQSDNQYTNNHYSGHFIVVIGYDDYRNIVFYRNPASARNLSFTSYHCFEAARRSYGTDEDVLFIYEI